MSDPQPESKTESVAYRVGVRIATWLAAILALIGAAVAATLGYVYFNAAEISGWGADKLLTNARAPADHEPPVTAYPHSYAAADVQVVGGQGRELSCSIGGRLEHLIFPRAAGRASISLQMRQACVFHDYCYRHGAATYGYSQADCDYLLLEHAYRICRVVSSERSVADCVQRARLVALGVRVGGGDNFKRADRIPHSAADTARESCHVAGGNRLIDDRCASTYFEFDPYPVRSAAYTVYRVADTPATWSGFLPKALYMFEMRPSGTRLTIVGWDQSRRAFCAVMRIPGDFAFLNTAPQVVRTEVNGSGDDWLVWWRRYNLDRTGGHLTMIAPGRASLADWQRAFPGTADFTPPTCNRAPALPATSAAAANVVWIGDAPPDPAQSGVQNDDPNVSELHPVAGLPPAAKIRLMALRMHSCATNPPVMCFHDMTVDPAGPRQQRTEALRARDALNRDGAGVDPDRYRNFVAPPFVLAGTDGPMLAWLRRGESDGTGYETSALLRRVQRAGNTGRSAGMVRLHDFNEAAEPVIVLERATARPRLLSIAAGAQGVVTMRQWSLPPVLPAAQAADGQCEPAGDRPGPIHGLAQATICPQVVAAECTRQLDETWLMRPPIVLGAADGATRLVFSRTVVAGGPAPDTGDPIGVEVRSATLKGNACTISEPRTQAIDIVLPRSPEEKARPMAAGVRARPVLVADLEMKGRYEVIVPSVANAGRIRPFALD